MTVIRSVEGKNLSWNDENAWIGGKVPTDGDHVVISSGSHFSGVFPNPPRNRAERRALERNKQLVPPKIKQVTIENGGRYGW